MNLPSLKKKTTTPAIPQWQRLLTAVEHLQALGVATQGWSFKRVFEPYPAPGVLAQSWPGGGGWLIVTGPDAKGRIPDDAGRIIAIPLNNQEPPRPLEQLEADLAYAMASPEVVKADRLSTFAETFPALRGKMGVRPWQARQVDRWCTDTQSLADINGAHAARFVLNLFNPGAWVCGRFDAIKALHEWDEPHRAAFIAWAQAPWWPR